MSGLFTAEGTKVRIYYDDGTGAAKGSALWIGRFLQALSASLGKAYEQIPHAGYPTQENRLGVGSFTLQLEKGVESSSRDLLLSDALYYIEVEVYTDRREAWTIYKCKKARRISWDLGKPDTGIYIARASFIVEDIEPVDQ